MRDHHRSLVVVLATAVFSVASASAAPAATVPSSDSSAYFVLLNAERSAHGLAPLRMSADLVAVAQGWASHMANAGQLAHNPQLTTAVTGWRSVGENVGEGPTISDLDHAFLASPEHRA